VVVSVVCGSSLLWWLVLCWWLPVGLKCVGVSCVCSVLGLLVFQESVCECLVNGVCGCLLEVGLCEVM